MEDKEERNFCLSFLQRGTILLLMLVPLPLSFFIGALHPLYLQRTPPPPFWVEAGSSLMFIAIASVCLYFGYRWSASESWFRAVFKVDNDKLTKLFPNGRIESGRWAELNTFNRAWNQLEFSDGTSISLYPLRGLNRQVLNHIYESHGDQVEVRRACEYYGLPTNADTFLKRHSLMLLLVVIAIVSISLVFYQMDRG